MEALIEKLNKLKGVLLLSSSGSLYILVGFDVVRNALIKTRKNIFSTKIEEVSYISQVELDHDRRIAFTYDSQPRVTSLINDLIEDRNRYLRMLRGLSEHGYTIRKKQ
jgi:hypothetical protein